MYIVISCIVVTVIVGFMFIWGYSLSRNTKQKESNSIISNFEPDNISPELTDMINFHKENGTVKYQI